MSLLNDVLGLVRKYAGPVATYLATYGGLTYTGALADAKSALLSVVPAVAHVLADEFKAPSDGAHAAPSA